MYISTLGAVIYFVFAHIIKITRFLNFCWFGVVNRLSHSETESGAQGATT